MSTVAAAPALLAAKVLVVSMVAAGSVTAAVVVARGPSEPDVGEGTASSPPSAMASPSPSPLPVAPVENGDAIVRDDVAPSPPASATSLPVASAAAVASAAPHAATGAASSVKPEVEHLAVVRQAGDPASALARAEEGHARFPRGVFWQEREAIAIASLVRLGRGDEARSRARAFLARHPESPYATTLRRVVGE